MSNKIILIDEKMNSIVLELSQQQLKLIGVKIDSIKKSKSRRQLDRTISEFLNNQETI